MKVTSGLFFSYDEIRVGNVFAKLGVVPEYSFLKGRAAINEGDSRTAFPFRLIQCMRHTSPKKKKKRRVNSSIIFNPVSYGH